MGRTALWSAAYFYGRGKKHSVLPGFFLNDCTFMLLTAQSSQERRALKERTMMADLSDKLDVWGLALGEMRSSEDRSNNDDDDGPGGRDGRSGNGKDGPGSGTGGTPGGTPEGGSGPWWQGRRGYWRRLGGGGNRKGSPISGDIEGKGSKDRAAGRNQGGDDQHG